MNTSNSRDVTIWQQLHATTEGAHIRVEVGCQASAKDVELRLAALDHHHLDSLFPFSKAVVSIMKSPAHLMIESVKNHACKIARHYKPTFGKA